MSLKISAAEAAAVVRSEAELACTGHADEAWTAKIERLSELCEAGVSKTHVAFLGTVILAKAVNPTADLFAIKPEHAPGNAFAFSARSLCHGVLVPLSAELGISLGVTGREPLNNPPYFRMTRLDDGTPVHPGGREAFDYMVGLVRELQELKTTRPARRALRAFIAVRSRYQRRYTSRDCDDVRMTIDGLIQAIESFVGQDSEGGRRAQAVVAGLLDVFAGPDWVDSGRINDPSRHYPGDVCVAAETGEIPDKAFEVRDKRVSLADVLIFGKKCVDMGVREAAVIAVAADQEQLDQAKLGSWAREFGIGLTVFIGWAGFVDQALFWADLPKPVAATNAVKSIRNRLVAVEVSPETVAQWDSLTAAQPGGDGS